MTNDILISRSQVVRIHLDALDQLINCDQPGVSEAVRASLSLRFLMDANALHQVGRETGIDIKVPAPVLDGIPIETAILFACGGYQIGRTFMSPHYSYRESGMGSVHRGQLEHQLAASPEAHMYAELPLSRFWRQSCLGLLGQRVCREDAVRYVANKCGGSHFDDSVAKYNEIQNRLTTIGHVLGLDGQRISVVFLETLGSAWFLLNAPGVVALRAVLAEES